MLSDEQREVIRSAIQGLGRRQIVPLVQVNETNQVLEFWLVRHLTNEPLCIVGTAQDVNGISVLADAIGTYLDSLFEGLA